MYIELFVCLYSTPLLRTKVSKSINCSLSQDKVIRLEQDAGAEFRQRMSTLKRQLEDAKGQGESLETQLQLSRQHAEQYKEMSLANENALAELNKTSEEFRWAFLQLYSEPPSLLSCLGGLVGRVPACKLEIPAY